jgi:deoxyinosine 3'endonuclease (endonuclease V)
VVYEDMQPLCMQTPYIPGFLAFREVPAFQQLLQRVRAADGGRHTPEVRAQLCGL